MLDTTFHAAVQPLTRVSIPQLDSQTSTRYLSLIALAQQASRLYDGSNRQRLHLKTVMAHVRNFAAGYCRQGQSLPDVINALSSQASTFNKNSPFSLEDLYRKARARVRGEPGLPSRYDFLKASSEASAGGFKKGKAYPVTGENPFSSGRSLYQPKVSALIDELCANDMGLEDINILTGPYVVPQDLKDSYVILQINRMRIAVCDNEAAPTYISVKNTCPDFWNDPAVVKAETSDFCKLCRTVRELILFPDDSSDDDKALTSERYTRGRFKERALALPMPASPSLPALALTPQQKLDQGINHLIEYRRLLPKFSDGTSAKEFMKDWMISIISAHKNRHGVYPQYNTGNVDGVPSVTFLMFNDAIYANGRAHRMNLQGFIEREFNIRKSPRACVPA